MTECAIPQTARHYGREDREQKDYTEVTESAEFAEKRSVRAQSGVTVPQGENPRTGLKTGHYKPKMTQDPGTDSVPGATFVRFERVKEWYLRKDGPLRKGGGCDTLRDRVALGENVAAYYDWVRYGPCQQRFCKLARNIRIRG